MYALKNNTIEDEIKMLKEKLREQQNYIDLIVASIENLNEKLSNQISILTDYLLADEEKINRIVIVLKNISEKLDRVESELKGKLSRIEEDTSISLRESTDAYELVKSITETYDFNEMMRSINELSFYSQKHYTKINNIEGKITELEGKIDKLKKDIDDKIDSTQAKLISLMMALKEKKETS